MARQLIVMIAESAERRRATTQKQPHRPSEKTVANVVVAENWTNHSASNPRRTPGTRWFNGNEVAQKYRQGGSSELLVVKSAPGKSPQLTSEALAGLQERLEQPPGFKSYGEIVECLNQAYQLNLTYPTVYNWVHYRLLKAKLKVPRPQC